MPSAQSTKSTLGREFHFNDNDFQFICRLVGERTGIVLTDAKRDMVYSRLARRIRQLGMDDFASYCRMLKNGDEQELAEFTNAITTNLTAFFREKHHFEFLKEKYLPYLKATKSNRRIRIWSAGCSSGEEPYSIAMTVRQVFPKNSNWDIKILATDLDSNMVNTAKQGIYTEDRVAGIDERLKRTWVRRGKDELSGKIRMCSDIQEMITFKQLNLLHQWPMKGPFDFIFCRNVVIYFNKETQKILFNRYADLMVDKSYLFIGHSESLHTVTKRFELVGNTIYQKVE